MPIQFRDADEVDSLGAAAYLKIDESADSRQYRGALFFVNARGEPVEFTFNKVEIPNTFLWRGEDVRRHAARRLTVSLLEASRTVPQFLVCLAEEIHHELFSNEIALVVPVCRLASPLKATPHSSQEMRENLDTPEPAHLFWFPKMPDAGSIQRQLLERISSRGLLTEPFERCLIGLREVYPLDAKVVGDSR